MSILLVTERDRAAVHVHAVEVGLVHLRPRQHYGGERLVDLEHVEVRHRHARPVEHLVRGVDRAVEQVVRVGAGDELVQRAAPAAAARAPWPCPRPSRAPRRRRRRSATTCPRCGCTPSYTGLSFASPSIVVSRRPWSRDDRLRLAGGLTVLTDHRRLDRRDLALEAAFVPRDLRLALRVEAPLVEVLAGDARACRRCARPRRTGRWAGRRTDSRRSCSGRAR